jgi:DNA/RNA-binding domain of Phe-tRNA-synthetase-like protein
MPEPDVLLLRTTWPCPLSELPSPDWLLALTDPSAHAALPRPDDAVRAAVRDLLRAGGFSPSGRNKPCSEYIRAAADKREFPVINAAVDVANLAGLHGGLPTGVLDLDLLTPPLTVGFAARGARFVFNRSGQELDLSGLLCVHDGIGPCASPVKDPMRAKTRPETTTTLPVVYGTSDLPGRAEAVLGWIADLHLRLGATPSALPAD